MNKLKILFMGTPDFAREALAALIEAGENICAVFTQPDKPKGRGLTLTPPPVKVLAMEKGIDVYQPTTLKTEEAAALLHELDPDLIIVAAYGKILPHEYIAYPKYGCVNAHASLLPKYRGAAPIQRAIMDGETETGVTAMRMDDGLDTGDMILTEKVAIGPDDNLEVIHDRLAEAGGRAMLRTIRQIEDGTITFEKQDDSKFTYAPKIEKSDCAIDFTKDAVALHNQIRALSPMPLAFTKTPDGKLLKIVKARPLSSEGSTIDVPPGTVLEVSDVKDGFIRVACGNGAVEITELLPEGKSKMSAAAFVRGRKIAVGDILGIR